MAHYRIDRYRAGDLLPRDMFTIVASGNCEAISEARAYAPVGQPDLARFTVTAMRGKNSKIIFDSEEAKNAPRP